MRLLLCLLFACGQVPEPLVSHTAADPSLTQVLPLEHRPDLLPLITESGFEGSFVAWESGAAHAICVGQGCETRVPPVSTFKIPHALIALDLEVLEGPDHMMRWDGVHRQVESWNQDQTLRTAIERSAVWYFQRVAPHVGTQRMGDALQRFEYGNRTIGRIDKFWLDGSLRISPVEQVRWWHRFAGGQLSVGVVARRQVLDICELARGDSAVLRAKTGWDRRDGETNHGWFAGCVEPLDGGARTCFATVLTARDPFDHDRFSRSRRAVTERIMRELGHPMPN